jgi:type I site-specific restriction-modification system R (restriction) subunit
MAKDENFILEDSKKLMISDEIIVQAIQELYKDEIKERIREKLKENPRMENELKDSIRDYTRGKLLEAGAQAKMLKVVAELGLISIPESFRDEMIKSILKAIGPELDTLLKNTL